MPLAPDFVLPLLYEKLDKQIVARIPYALIVALLVYLFADDYVEDYYDCFLFWTITTPIIFLFGNTYFNWKINRLIETRLFSNTEYINGPLRLEQIMGGKISLLGDALRSKKKRDFALAAFAGGSLTAFFCLVILLFLLRIPVEFEQILFSIIIGAIFVYYDLLKSPLQIGDSQEKFSRSPLFGYFEKYALSNSMSDGPSFHPSGLRFAGRVLGPVLELRVPRISYDVLIVYCSRALNERLTTYSDGGHGHILLKNVDGMSMKELIAHENSRRSQKIYRTTESPPVEIFPYLVGSDAKSSSNSEQILYGSFSIHDTDKNQKPVGHVHIHLFRGPKIIKRLRPSLESKRAERRGFRRHRGSEQWLAEKVTEEAVFYFTFVAEKTIVHYLKTQIQMLAIRFPPELMQYTVGDEGD